MVHATSSIYVTSLFKTILKKQLFSHNHGIVIDYLILSSVSLPPKPFITQEKVFICVADKMPRDEAKVLECEV